MRPVAMINDNVADLLSMPVMQSAIIVLIVDSNAVGNLVGTSAKT
jgi:hypothetical protein